MAEQTVLVTGGGGYVGAALVPKLLAAGHKVRVLDLMLYGDRALDAVAAEPGLQLVRGDIRDRELLDRHLPGVDSVIHLACISNDPSFDLDPDLGRSINYDAFRPLVEASRRAGVRRFVYASSSSVYGVKDTPEVDEDQPLEPLTDYSRFKADCERILEEYQGPSFTTVTLRPATVCGVSARQRFDLIVNILTNHAYRNRKIRVFGGDQLRPNIHIDDMVDAYLHVLSMPESRIAGRIYNVGYENHSVRELAEQVRAVIGDDVETETVPTDDERSYHISSRRISDELDFRPKRTIADAVKDLRKAFDAGSFEDSLENDVYFNIRTMLKAELR